MPRGKDKPIQIADGAWYALAFALGSGDDSEPFSEECCDCGLVHDITYKVENGRIWVRYVVNRRVTRLARARRAREAAKKK